MFQILHMSKFLVNFMLDFMLQGNKFLQNAKGRKIFLPMSD